MNAPLLELRKVVKTYPLRKAHPFAQPRSVKALEGLSLSVARGETLALVGESGCGKSTLGRCVAGLQPIDSGAIHFDGSRIDAMSRARRQGMNRRLQMIFQDPSSSLNPRMRIGEALAEPLRNYRKDLSPEAVSKEVQRLLDLVQMPVDSATRWPHEFSGGQAQRIAIARALASGPELIVCDEATSALDVSIKAQIINLLKSLQKELDLALLFISHDLGIVRAIAQRVAVMYRGTIVEEGPSAMIFDTPCHPYTKALLSAVLPPRLGKRPERTRLEGEPPSGTAELTGCPFVSRCPEKMPHCAGTRPLLSPQADQPARAVACLLHPGGLLHA